MRKVRRKNSTGSPYSSARLVPPHLVEVGGELGLLVAAGRDVGVRRDDLPPRLQPARRLALDRGDRRLALRLAGLLGERDRSSSCRIRSTSSASSAAETARSRRWIVSSAR